MIRLEQMHVHAGAFALRDVSVELEHGTWGIVLGPAGAGKTTLLEAIAGVRRVSGGRVWLRGRDVTSLPPEQRGVAMVYQHGYLFPHLSVEENVRYGSRDAHYAHEMAARLGADELRGRPVHSLSGGERQIVALTRALAAQPDILLLDEPFSALDPRRRTRVRRVVQALRRERELTVLQVTHDFAEAGTLGDVALLMDAGRLVQAAPPAELFRKPATAAAAEFLGLENIYAGAVTPLHEGEAAGQDTLQFVAGSFELVATGRARSGAAHAVIRAEEVALSRELLDHASGNNVLHGVVVEVAVHGLLARVSLDVGGVPLVSVITAAAADAFDLQLGVEITATVMATAVHLC